MIWGSLKSNHLCLCQDTEIPTGCSGDKYGIAFNRDFLPVRNSTLLLTEINNTANRGSATSRIPYGNQ